MNSRVQTYPRITTRSCLGLLAMLTAIIQPASAEACSCGGAASSATAFRGSDLVFTGTQLVLPPGDFEIWVERAGRPVNSRKMVHIDDGVEQHLMLVVEYEN